MKKNLLLLLVCSLIVSVNVVAKSKQIKISKAERTSVFASTDATGDIIPCEGEKCKKGDKCCKKKKSKASAKNSKCCSAEASASGKSCCMKKDKVQDTEKKKEETK